MMKATRCMIRDTLRIESRDIQIIRKMNGAFLSYGSILGRLSAKGQTLCL